MWTAGGANRCGLGKTEIGAHCQRLGEAECWAGERDGWPAAKMRGLIRKKCSIPHILAALGGPQQPEPNGDLDAILAHRDFVGFLQNERSQGTRDR